MKIRFRHLDTVRRFAAAKQLPPNFSDHRALPERTSSISLDLSGPIRKWRTDFLFDYRIFPDNILTFEAEWLHKNRKMAVGDTILQRARIPPARFGVRLEFAVRVRAMFDEEKRMGFAYETLTGHPERGRSEFYFEERDGELFFTIHTFSEPGHWTSRAVKHVFTLPFQAWCTRRALEQVRRRFHVENPRTEASYAVISNQLD